MIKLIILWILFFTSGTFYFFNYVFVYEGFLNIIVLNLPFKYWFFIGNMDSYGIVLEERRKLMESRKKL